MILSMDLSSWIINQKGHFKFYSTKHHLLIFVFFCVNFVLKIESAVTMRELKHLRRMQEKKEHLIEFGDGIN